MTARPTIVTILYSTVLHRASSRTSSKGGYFITLGTVYEVVNHRRNLVLRPYHLGGSRSPGRGVKKSQIKNMVINDLTKFAKRNE